MTVMKIYTGGGVSLSPEYIEGRTESAYIRLIADDDMMLKNGEQTAVCIDVLAADADNWVEVDYSEPEDGPTADEVLDIILGVSE